MADYTPIDCVHYDELVQLAMDKTPLVFLPNTHDIGENVHVVDLVTTSTKEEFMELSTGQHIRLDEISNISEHMIFLNVSEDFFLEEE